MKKKKDDSRPMTFEESEFSPKKKLNSHINFDLEGSKGNSRKVATPVTCSKCRAEFILPFKPRKPEVYCDKCFKKINKREKKH